MIFGCDWPLCTVTSGKAAGSYYMESGLAAGLSFGMFSLRRDVGFGPIASGHAAKVRWRGVLPLN